MEGEAGGLDLQRDLLAGGKSDLRPRRKSSAFGHEGADPDRGCADAQRQPGACSTPQATFWTAMAVAGRCREPCRRFVELSG
jgi:hypothetical protein